MVRPGLREVIPFASEFIRIQDGAKKQDCEINAGLRAIERVRDAHRQLPAIVLGDALYATERLSPPLVIAISPISLV